MTDLGEENKDIFTPSSAIYRLNPILSSLEKAGMFLHISTAINCRSCTWTLSLFESQGWCGAVKCKNSSKYRSVCRLSLCTVNLYKSCFEYIMISFSHCSNCLLCPYCIWGFLQLWALIHVPGDFNSNLGHIKTFLNCAIIYFATFLMTYVANLNKKGHSFKKKKEIIIRFKTIIIQTESEINKPAHYL